jgi:hypothetical protein
MRTLRNSAIFWVVMAVALSAAAVWEEKPFTQWSEKDVEKILTESPWAGKASITHEKAGADLGPVPDWKLIVSVRSATPVRQAMARELLLAGGTASPDLESNLAIPHPRYAFAIAGIPQLYRTQLTKSAQVATIRLKGKQITATEASVSLVDKEGNPVQPPAAGPGGPGRGRQQASNGVQIIPVAQRGGGGGGFGGGGGGGFGGGGFGEDKSGITAVLIVEFPKADPVASGDGEVEVSTVIGGYRVKKDFKLKDMMYKGALAF